jgi:acyl-CoA synthetase (AMP-forming)/AMP-acid ligase II
MTLVSLPRFDAKAVLDAIQENGATMYEGVPTSYMMMLAYPELNRYDFSTLNRLTVGGQTMPLAKQQEVETRFGAPLLDLLVPDIPAVRKPMNKKQHLAVILASRHVVDIDPVVRDRVVIDLVVQGLGGRRIRNHKNEARGATKPDKTIHRQTP